MCHKIDIFIKYQEENENSSQILYSLPFFLVCSSMALGSKAKQHSLCLSKLWHCIINWPIKLSLSIHIDYYFFSLIDEQHVSNLLIFIIKVKDKQISFAFVLTYIQCYFEICCLNKYCLGFKIILTLKKFFFLWKCPDPIWTRVCLCSLTKKNRREILEKDNIWYEIP